MYGLLLRWFTTAAALWITSLLFSGIRVSGVFALFLASLALAILNAVVRPLLLLATLPLTVVTLGLFVFVVNAIVLKMAAFFVSGFDVRGFWTAVFGAIALSIINMLLTSLLGDRDTPEYLYIEYRTDD